MTLSAALAAAALCIAGQLAPDVVLEGDVPADADEVFAVPFEVPQGVVEMTITHDDGSEANILDWGLLDETGAFRGWGGGNTEPAVVGVAASSRSYLRGPINAGTWSLLVGQAKITDAPGHYRAEVTFRDVATLPPAEDRRVFDFDRVGADISGWVAGDLHVHSLDSGDATASLEDIGAFAATRGLDFVVITDHNTTSHFDQLDAAMNQAPEMVFLPGIEVTTYHGHLALIGATAWLDFRLHGTRDLDAFIIDAHAQGALLSANHPTLDLGDACIGCAFDLDGDRTALDAVEVQTGANRLFTEAAIAFWDDVAGDAMPPPALGGSDDHRAGVVEGIGQSPIGTPTTMVEVAELSASGVLAGIRAGRTVVKLDGPDGPMVVLDGQDRAGNVIPATGSGSAFISATVTGGAGLSLYWIVDGRLDSVETLASDDAAFEVELNAGSWARVELWDDTTPITIASPVIVGAPPEPTPPTGGGCACVALVRPPPALGVLALLLPLGLLRRHRRR